MAQVVYTAVNDQSELKGSLFQGQRIWFSQKVPQRTWFIKQVESNGGVVVPLEKQANIKLVDHTRKDLPPDTYSYKYVEISMRKGQLEDLNDHVAGPPAGTIRSAGSTTMPAKGSRNSFTKEDDQVLWDWVTSQERRGGYIQGNEIYKQLEEVNSRHTWQSWRDRWIKTLSSRPRPIHRSEDTARTPPADTNVTMDRKQTQNKARTSKDKAKSKVDFTPQDAKELLSHAEHILDIGPEQTQNAWEAWANANPEHTAKEWQDFFERRVLPIYERNSARFTRQRNQSKKISVASPKANGAQTKSQEKTFLKDSPLPSRAKKATSPELELQYPRLRSAQKLKPQSSNRPSNKVEDAQSASSGSQGNRSVRYSLSPKRKRNTFEEVASSSPLKPATPTVSKRPRYTVVEEQVPEIPSTPEREPTPIQNNLAAYNINPEEVIGLEGSDEAGSEILGMPASQSLSEPDRSGQTTRQDVSQTLDFELPAPEGGWDDDITLAEPPIEILETQQKPGKEDTQTLLTGQTQIPDFLVPEPDGGWDALTPSSSPPSPILASEPIATRPETENVNAIPDKWIEKQLKEGIPITLITLALKSTNMDPILAKTILKSLVAGKGVPNDLQGVWTEEDDEDLRANDSRRVKRVHDKHGTEGFSVRWEFLDDYENVE